MDLKTYLETMSLDDRGGFAERCGTSAGHLRNISYGYKTCREKLAINIERESQGAVTIENLCPDVDWAYVRASRCKPQRGHRARVN